MTSQPEVPLIDPALQAQPMEVPMTRDIYDVTGDAEQAANERTASSLRFLEKPYRSNNSSHQTQSQPSYATQHKQLENEAKFAPNFATTSNEESLVKNEVLKPFVPPLDLSILHEHGSGSGKQKLLIFITYLRLTTKKQHNST